MNLFIFIIHSFDSRWLECIWWIDWGINSSVVQLVEQLIHQLWVSKSQSDSSASLDNHQLSRVASGRPSIVKPVPNKCAEHDPLWTPQWDKPKIGNKQFVELTDLCWMHSVVSMFDKGKLPSCSCSCVLFPSWTVKLSWSGGFLRLYWE